MKQIIPFEKEITFKTTIGEITSISLENDLKFDAEDTIRGNFYVKGTYKMLSSSSMEEQYSYKIPCEINISDEYDALKATLDIDDFNYEISDNTLKLTIDLLVDNLTRKEQPSDRTIQEEQPIEESKPKDFEQELTKLTEEIKSPVIESQEQREPTPAKEYLSFKEEETYLTYSIYLVQEQDTLDSIMKKYQVSYEDLQQYNNLDNVMPATKLIIPNLK